MYSDSNFNEVGSLGRLFPRGCYGRFLSIFCDPRVSTRGIASIYIYIYIYMMNAVDLNRDINMHIMLIKSYPYDIGESADNSVVADDLVSGHLHL